MCRSVYVSGCVTDTCRSAALGGPYTRPERETRQFGLFRRDRVWEDGVGEYLADRLAGDAAMCIERAGEPPA